ncbi:unnamed protein product [Mycena citricolor]|uniref:1,3-beta-glucanosyltransferase n=2 Tax=Mycena citricolor TaxID=2018698 RepID=A0AAD2HTH3_9AGAR|nr:unnamed protein product [Mycena citricolor]
MKLLSSLLLVAALPLASAISKITRTGRYLYSADGSRFYIKGVAYQTQGVFTVSPSNPLGAPTTFVDQLANSAGCTRDLPFLQQLGVNAIRAYSVDSTLDHDSCMNALSAAGIYYIDTINVFSKYDNILAYNIGNEVVTASATAAAPFLKAAARDTKAYLASIGSSALVGYADIDGPSPFRDAVATYLSCDPSGQNSGSSAIDLFGLNNYEWCGNASTTTYDGINAEFANYNVVAYFSEFGSEDCKPTARPWTEVSTLFASPMTNVWSGGVAFSYFSAISRGSDFGLITLSADNSTVTVKQDFTNLANEFKGVSFVNSPSQGSVSASSFGACPSTSPNLEASSNLPPTPNTGACSCIEQSLSCQFKATGDFNAVLGTLTGTVCGLLPQVGGNCNDIATNGTTGVYGSVSSCDPTVRISYAFSQYYELNGRVAASCDFAGNATVNSAASASTAAAVVSSCLPSPSAVFTASAPPGASSVATAGSSSTTASSSGTAKTGAAVPVGPTGGALAGLATVISCVLTGMIWTVL